MSPFVNIKDVPRHAGLAIAQDLMDQNVLGLKGSNAAIAEAQRITIIVQTYAPGGLHKPHAHTDKEQAFLVLSGKGQMHLGGEVHPIEEGTVIYAPRNVEHSTENTGEEELVMMLIDVKLD